MGDVYAIRSLESPLGRLQLAVTAAGVVRLSLPRSSGAGFRGGLEHQLPEAERVASLPGFDTVAAQLDEYFHAGRRMFTLPLDLRGTPFQLAVWRALLMIPYGDTQSYADLARIVGHPKAFRAVGAANGANPLPILVPCHRVISSDGTLGGYAGGIEIKRRLLAHEKNVAHGALSPARREPLDLPASGEDRPRSG